MCTLMSLNLTAQSNSKKQPEPNRKLPQIDIPYTKYVLDNGLTLLVHEDNRTPLISLTLYYHVGRKQGRNARQDRVRPPV